MNKKIVSALLVLLLITACSLGSLGSNGNQISGATAMPPVPAAGSILFQDSFDNPSSGWERISDPNTGIMDYNEGVYRIFVSAPLLDMFATPGLIRQDTRIEVDAVKLGGPDENRGGIICRMSTLTDDVTSYYFFVITNNGYYGVGRSIKSSEKTESALLGQSDFVQSSAIKTGLAINHLRADCIGSTLSFYVNGFLVSQVNDTTLADGEVGVLAGTFDQPGVDMVFDNFLVIQP
jgi:hypothetical protein